MLFFYSIEASLYQANSEFTCFDGSGVIPFGYVNDDYCDCADGCDEPGKTTGTRIRFFSCFIVTFLLFN